MANRWGDSGNSVRFYFWGVPKSLQMVTAAMKLKDACSLEEKLWPTWWRFSRSVVSDSCDPMDCSLPGSSGHGIFQARILEWVAISFSRGSSQPRDCIQVFCIARRRFYLLSRQRKPLVYPQIIKTFSCFLLGILVLGFTFRSMNHFKLIFMFCFFFLSD